MFNYIKNTGAKIKKFFFTFVWKLKIIPIFAAEFFREKISKKNIDRRSCLNKLGCLWRNKRLMLFL